MLSIPLRAALAAFVTLQVAPAPARAEAWDEIDLSTLPERLTKGGQPAYHYPSNLPEIASVPPHPVYGTLVAIIPQKADKASNQIVYRPAYAAVAEGRCTVVQTVILAGDWGQRIADLGEPPAGPKGPVYLGPLPRTVPVSSMPGLVEGYAGRMAGCNPAAYLTRTVDEEDNFVAAFDNRQKVVPIEKAAFRKILEEGPMAPLKVPAVLTELRNPMIFRAAFAGWFDGLGRPEAVQAYRAIVAAHSRQVVAEGEACAYPGDAAYQIRSTDPETGKPWDKPVPVVLPPEQADLFGRMVYEDTRDSMYILSFRSDAERIVEAGGCRGPLTQLLREQLFRKLDRQPSLSREEIEARMEG